MTNIQDFDFDVNLLESLLWQYNDAERLQSILQQKQDWFKENHTDFWDDWYDNVFNLDTANDFGLTVWAKILEVSFAAETSPERETDVFGYGTNYQSFFECNFSPTGGDDIILNTEQKRSILKLTYQNYVNRGTVPDINKMLTSFYGFKVYVIDTFDMAGSIAVLSGPTNAENQEIIKKYDLVPRPAGVGIEFRTVTKNEFGFANFGMNFFNGFFGKNKE